MCSCLEWQFLLFPPSQSGKSVESLQPSVCWSRKKKHVHESAQRMSSSVSIPDGLALDVIQRFLQRSSVVSAASAKYLNPKIQTFFLVDLVSVPSADLYWDHFTSNTEWRKVWSLPRQTKSTKSHSNKSTDLIPKVLLSKSKFKVELNISCTFYQKQPETSCHSCWSCD